MAGLKISRVLYAALGTLGLAAVLLVPITLYRAATPALPLWANAVSPGPLSAAHAFLGAHCESCHTPNRGIEAVSCITCHAPDAGVLGKQSTAFHATIQDCSGCHIEHAGVGARPVRIDHSLLTMVAVWAAHAGTVAGLPASTEATAIGHWLAGATGNGPATDSQVLDCASCHSLRDKHLGLFGQQCADCHVTQSWKIAGFLHPSPKSQDCNQCHQAPPSHYMMHFAMMDQGVTGQKAARVEQCFMCHQTDAFNDIKGVGWFKMH